MKTKTWLTTLLLVILLSGFSFAGDRRNIKVHDSGKKTETGYPISEHYTLLDLGECDWTGCVIAEHTTKGGLLYQEVDKDGDGVCDIIKAWKPLVDPTFGTFYTLHRYKLCRGTI